MPNTPEEFMECDTCRAKPGSPYLCAGCLHNREVISKLAQARLATIEEMKQNTSMLRQWLNRDRITDPKKMVTNEQIMDWLNGR